MNNNHQRSPNCEFRGLHAGVQVNIWNIAPLHQTGCGRRVPITTPTPATYCGCDGYHGRFDLAEPFPCPHCGGTLYSVWSGCGFFGIEFAEVEAIAVEGWPVRLRAAEQRPLP